ncbi:glycosyltransferase [Caldivirga sp. UBA161]|uniref:glycosyltransferase n=1 Tax=Caldivirga sp. UBA161 TaxID=1915569 RepID=UPI0025BD63E8|nr:glycosyltransferase [Caldivirga sp. UBA161]
MRVLIYWSINGIGGAQRLYVMLAKALMECGVNVDILTNNRINLKLIEMMHGVRLNGINVRMVSSIPCSNSLCGLVNSTIRFQELINIINEYDLVYLDDLYLSRLIKHSGIIFYIHGYIDRKRPIAPLAKPHRMLPLAIQALGSSYDIIKNAKFVFANSYVTAYITYKTIGIMPKVLHPPVDVKLAGKYRSSIREDAVVSFGRLGSAKGHELAVMIISKLRERGIKAKAYIMGSVEDISSRIYAISLLKLAEELGVAGQVRLILNPSLAESYSVLGRSKVFIHGKPHEPFGIVVVEAMATGTVPVVPRSGGPWHDIISYGKYGLGYSTLDEASNAVEYLLGGGFNDYSKLAMERASEFSYEKFKDRLCSIIT